MNEYKNIASELLTRLFPLNRSLTGPDNLKSFNIIKEILTDLNIHAIPSGTKVFDWTTPKYYSIKIGLD